METNGGSKDELVREEEKLELFREKEKEKERDRDWSKDDILRERSRQRRIER